MKNKFSELVKIILPNWLVSSIKKYRKKLRNKKRFHINNGESVLKKIEVDLVSFYIYVNPFLNGGVDEDIYLNGQWEPEISQIISEYLPDKGTFLDIGGNIGYHSLYAAALPGKEITVVVFEPVKRLAEQMKSSAQYNSFQNITIHNVGLSNIDGIGHLSLVEENIGASSLQSVAKDRSVGEVIEVPIVRFDALEADFDRLDVVKIDIEGGELEALKGAKNALIKHRPVIILEFSPQVYEKDFLGKSLELYQFLIDLHYTVTVVDDKNFDIKKHIDSKDFSLLHTNLLCVPLKTIS